MKRLLPLLSVLLFSFATFTALAQELTDTTPIDFDKARALISKMRDGETLTESERAYLERAEAMRQQQQQQNRPGAPGGGGGAQRKAPDQLTPLTDFSGDTKYEGESGGLYGNGLNRPSESLQTRAETELGKIQALDAEGKPSSEGKIVFISISMSNATQEFSRFKQLADQSDKKAANVTVVDCAQGGQAMAEWVPEDARPWQVALERIAAAGVSPNQVQVAWVKLANKGPSGSLEEHGRKLESDTLAVLQNAKARFPNLRIAYLGSRIWAGNAKGNLNPEPYAYESAFPARWLIQRQAGDDTELSLDKSPLLLWGPYLWAEGEKGRATDDLVWKPEDFAGDGVHPSPSGRQKVAELLLDFVTSDPLAKSWFFGK